MYQFITIDDCTRIRVLKVFDACNQRTAIRFLDEMVRRLPFRVRVLQTDNRNFVGRVLDAWTYAHGLTLRFIRPGKPIENAYIESFNGKFQDECLNEHWFQTVAKAQRTIDLWALRLQRRAAHSALGDVPPGVFAAAQHPRGLTLPA